MKRVLGTLLICLVWTATVDAQVMGGDQILTLNGGYATGTLEMRDQSANGGMFLLTLEQVSPNGISFAFSFGYLQLEAVEDTGQVVQERIRTKAVAWPLGLGARYWIGQSKFQGFVGGLFTVYFSSLDVINETTGADYTALATSGWGLQVPLGIAYSVSEKVFINGSYTLNWLWSNEIFSNDVVHNFYAGLGFKL